MKIKKKRRKVKKKPINFSTDKRVKELLRKYPLGTKTIIRTTCPHCSRVGIKKSNVVVLITETTIRHWRRGHLSVGTCLTCVSRQANKPNIGVSLTSKKKGPYKSRLKKTKLYTNFKHKHAHIIGKKENYWWLIEQLIKELMLDSKGNKARIMHCYYAPTLKVSFEYVGLPYYPQHLKYYKNIAQSIRKEFKISLRPPNSGQKPKWNLKRKYLREEVTSTLAKK